MSKTADGVMRPYMDDGGRKRKDCRLQSVDDKPGDNRRYLRHTMEIVKWGNVDLKDEQAVMERSIRYLEKCDADDIKPTIAEYALSLGIERQTLHKYRTAEIGKNPLVRDTLKRFCNIINSQMEHYMQNGKINPVSGIFLMKNNMGYTDKQEITVKPSSPLGETPSIEDIAARIDGTVVDD